jgi:PAS domain S-box-containing protein
MIDDSSDRLHQGRAWNILQRVADSAIATGVEGRITLMNAAAMRLTGWTVDEARGRRLSDVMQLVDGASGREVPLPEDRPGPGESTGLPAGTWLVAKGGQNIPIEGSIAPLEDESGRVEGRCIIFRDVGARGRFGGASRGDDGRFEALFNQAAVGIAQLDLAGHFLLVSERYCSIVGRPAAGLMGSRLFDILHPDDLRLTEDAFHRVARGGPDSLVEKRHLRRDGSIVWTSENISAVRDPTGSPRSVLTICQDITDRKRFEEELRRSEERLRVTYEWAPVGIGEFDPGGRFVRVNQRLCEITGYSRDELLARSARDIIHPEDAGGNASLLARLRAGERPCDQIEVRLIRRDGATVWVELVACLVPDRGDAEGFVLGIVQDVTDRRRAAEELRRAREGLERRVAERTAELAAAIAAMQGEVAERTRAEQELLRANQALRALIRASPLAIIALDAGGRVTIWNPAAERIFGWGERDVLGRPLPTIPEDLLPEFSSGLATSLRGDVHTGHETRRLRKDGSAIEVSLWTAPLYGPRGEPCGRLGVVEDITGRRRAEEARTALMRRIVTTQEEERLRIARELHDQMGQHLAALMLGLGAIKEHARAPVAAAEARRMHDLAGRIGQDVHRIALELRPTALDDWGLQTALTNYAGDWSRRARVPVQARFAGIDRRRLPPAVETALYRTAQEALTNVLKHAGAGRVSLIVERRPDHVLAIVEDDGRGFDVEAVMGAPDAGRRLGLLGMQERVALVGGSLEVESTPGGGTSLFVRIPLGDEGEADQHG